MTPLITDTLINAASGAILCKDVAHLRSILLPIWEDVSLNPDFHEFDNRAELLTIAGTYLSEYGKITGNREFQRRAKDVLTQAVDLYGFETEEAALTLVTLAYVYWHLGEMSNFEAILGSITDRFHPSHPAAIKIRVNQILGLTFGGEPAKAYELLREVYAVVDDCPSLEVKVQFHNAAGIVYGRRGDTDQSLKHLQQAATLSREIGNDQFLAINLNNAAMAYLEAQDFRNAHKYIAESLSAAVSKGWEPHFRDTQASIYLREHRYEEALEAIEGAIISLRDAGDLIGLSTALLTKCKALAHLERLADILIAFSELAAAQADPKMVEHYAKLLVEEFQPAAKTIRDIQRVRPQGKRICADFTYSGDPLFYYFKEALGSEPVIALIVPIENPFDGMRVLIERENGPVLGALMYGGSVSGLYAVEHEGEFTFLGDPAIIGTPVGYCSLAEAQNEIVTFQKL